MRASPGAPSISLLVQAAPDPLQEFFNAMEWVFEEMKNLKTE
jgi:hypothetical protein